MAMGRWMDKENVIYKKEWNISFVTTWLDLEGITLIKISQTEKDKILDGSTYMWNLKTKTDA